MGNHEEESCGWPKGTVRALIALIVIFFGIASLSTLMILLYTSDKFEAAIGVGSTIGGLVGIVIGYYFGSRSAEGAAQMISHTEEQLIKSQEIVNRGLMENVERSGRYRSRGRSRKNNISNNNTELDEIAIVL